MQAVVSPYMKVGIALVGAGVIAVAPMAPPPDLHAPQVPFTAALSSPAGLIGDLYGTGAAVSVALLDQVPDIAVVRAATEALRNLILNVPLAFHDGDPLVAIQALAGIALNAVGGFATGAVADINALATSVGILIPQMLTNLGVAIPAAFEQALTGNLPGALQTLFGPVLSAAVGIMGVAVPGLLPIIGAAITATTNLVQNLPLIIGTAIGEAFTGDLPGAVQTLVGPVAAAVLGVAGAAMPGLMPALSAASILLPQVGPNLGIAFPAALEQLSTGNLFGAMQTLISPLVNAVAGIAQAAWRQPAEDIGAPEDSIESSSMASIAAVSTPTGIAAGNQLLTLDPKAASVASIDVAAKETPVIVEESVAETPTVEESAAETPAVEEAVDQTPAIEEPAPNDAQATTDETEPDTESAPTAKPVVRKNGATDLRNGNKVTPGTSFGSSSNASDSNDDSTDANAAAETDPTPTTDGTAVGNGADSGSVADTGSGIGSGSADSTGDAGDE